MMIDINVILVDFKTSSVDEMVRHNEDDSFTILLNSRQASNRIEKAYRHAMWHIVNGDFDKEESIQKIEYIAHKAVR